jgi:hypothetical protein
MLAVMSWCWGASGIRTTASVAVLAAVLAGCRGDPSTQASPTTTPPTTAVTTPPTTDTPTATPIPSYTPPPGRGLKRPPGVAPVKGTPCEPALADEHIYEVSWYGSFATYAEDGERVPDFQWTGADKDLQRFRGGIGVSRAALRAAGVPTVYAAYRDLAELDAAMRDGIAVTRARDEDKVLSVFFRLKTAHDHLLESCSALER